MMSESNPKASTTSPSLSRYAPSVQEHGFYFIDIPRASSTSIRWELTEHFGALYGKRHTMDPNYSMPQLVDVHLTAAQARHLLTPLVWERIFTFTLVRNPFERVLSFFFFLQATGHIEQSATFLDYTRRLYDHVLTDEKRFIYAPVWMSNCDFVMHDGRILVDYVGRYENRQQDLAIIGKHIGLPNLGRTHTQRATPRGSHYSAWYDDESRFIISAIYREDLETFDYRYESIRTRVASPNRTVTMNHTGIRDEPDDLSRPTPTSPPGIIDRSKRSLPSQHKSTEYSDASTSWNSPVIQGSLLDTSQWRLQIVTRTPKQYVESLSEVSPKQVTITDIKTRMERPKTVQPDASERPWYGQLIQAFLLQLPDAFIGDNVVFDSARYYGFGKWWLGTRDASRQLYRSTQEVRHIAQGISITSWGGEAFQHFITDTLPRLPILFDLLERPEFANLKLVSHSDEAPTARWFWDKLGLSDRIVQKPKSAQAGFVIHADLVLYPDWGPNLDNLGLHPRGSLRPIQQRLGVLDGTDQNLVLYFGRGTRHRSVANRETLLNRVRQVLNGTSYQLQQFEASGDLQQDMELVKRAKVIFGPHGGAFANLVFAQPGTHVIEFLPIYRLYCKRTDQQDPRPLYWGLSQAASLDYWSVEPSNFDFDKPGMEVNVEEVATIIHQLVGGTSSKPTPAPRRRIRKTSRRNRVLHFGTPSYRRPKRFDWTSRESEATVDTAVMSNQHIQQQIDRPGRKIGWIRESPAIALRAGWTQWICNNLERVADAYDLILTSDRFLCTLHPKIQHHPAGANLPWPWIQEEDYRLYPKHKLCSMFASPKTMVDGHLTRHRYAERLQHQLDLYGGACGSPRIGGSGTHPDKSTGLLPYMFSVTMENCQTDFYYTEKITDCFASGTIPIYWGSDAIGEIFDTDGIIILDESFTVDMLSDKLYQKMLPAARNNLETTRNLELAGDLLYKKYIA